MIEALLVSVQVAALAVVVSLPVAVPLALCLARRSFRGKILVETVVALPLVLPPVVTGFVLLMLLGRGTLVGGKLTEVFGASLLFTPAAAVLAAAIVAFPLLVRTLRVAFEGVDPQLEEAASTLGATTWRTFTRVTLPLAWHGVVAGLVLAFGRALGEFGATLVVAGTLPGGRITAPVAVYRMLLSGDPWRARGLVGGLVIVALLTTACAELLVRGGRSRRGRRA